MGSVQSKQREVMASRLSVRLKYAALPRTDKP
jgi:hypothetical protein